MAKCNKLLEKARNSPNNLRIEHACALAECYGWIAVGGEGSHRVYMNPNLGNSPGSMMNFQSKKGKAKPYQVRKLLDAIEGLNHG